MASVVSLISGKEALKVMTLMTAFLEFFQIEGITIQIFL